MNFPMNGSNKTGPLNLSKPNATGPLSLPPDTPATALPGQQPAAKLPGATANTMPHFSTSPIVDQNKLQTHASASVPQLSLQFIDPADAAGAQLSFPDVSGAGKALNLNTESRKLTGDFLYSEFLVRTLNPQNHAPVDAKISKLDYTYSKLVTQGNNINLKVLSDKLIALRDELKAFHPEQPGAQTLSNDKINEYNKVLQPYGLMTDGTKLYNLASRSGQPKSDSAAGTKTSALPDTCSLADVENIISFAIVAMTRTEGQDLSYMQVQQGIHNLPLPEKLSFTGQAPAYQGGPSVSESMRFKKPPDFTSGITAISKTVQAKTNLENLIFRNSRIQGVATGLQDVIPESIETIQSLIPKQEAADRAIETAGEQNTTLQNAYQHEARILQKLAPRANQLLDAGKITEAIGTDPAAANRDLAPLELSVEKGAQGMRFLHKGKEVSEEEFRSLLYNGLKAQSRKVADLQTDLQASDKKVDDLKRNSAEISGQIQHARERLAGTLGKLPGTRAALLEHRQNILNLKQDPEQWNALSSDEQHQVDQLLKQTDEAIRQLDTLDKRGHETLSQADRQLSRSEKVRQKIQAILEMSRQLQGKYKPTADGANKILEKFRAQLDKDRKLAETTKELRIRADELQSLLNLTPGPDLAKLQKAGEDWLATLEQTVQDIQQHQGSQTKSETISHQNLERVARNLRENLTYQEQKLQELADSSRAKLAAALKASVAAVKALQHP